MNFNEPSSDYHWKIRLFGAFNVCVMLVHNVYVCAEFPFNLLYVLMQDGEMFLEFRHQCRDVNWRKLTFAIALDLILDAGWAISLYIFSFFGIHAVLIHDLTVAKPAYCKELNKRIGLA